MSGADGQTPFKRALGLRIAQLRAERGMSQRKLALVLGMDRVTLNRIEQGRGNPTLDTLQRIADGLDVPIEELFTGSDSLPV